MIIIILKYGNCLKINIITIFVFKKTENCKERSLEVVNVLSYKWLTLMFRVRRESGDSLERDTGEDLGEQMDSIVIKVNTGS